MANWIEFLQERDAEIRHSVRFFIHLRTEPILMKSDKLDHQMAAFPDLRNLWPRSWPISAGQASEILGRRFFNFFDFFRKFQLFFGAATVA